MDKDIRQEIIEEIEKQAAQEEQIEYSQTVVHHLLHSGVIVMKTQPGFVMVKESELAMVLEELKKTKNLQAAQQGLLIAKDRVQLTSELEKTQTALKKALEENAQLEKTVIGMQKRLDELEYRNVEAKTMTRLNEKLGSLLQEDSVDKPEPFQKKEDTEVLQTNKATQQLIIKTEKRRQEVKKLREKGLKPDQIAKKLGLGKSTVYNLLKE